MIWVRTANGTVRHPVNSWADEPEFQAKRLKCQATPLKVRLCTEAEVETMLECWRCALVIAEEAGEHG